MIEENILEKLSYFNLMLLIKYGILNNEEISQVKQIAETKPTHEKKLFELIQKKRELNHVRN